MAAPLVPFRRPFPPEIIGMIAAQSEPNELAHMLQFSYFFPEKRSLYQHILIDATQPGGRQLEDLYASVITRHTDLVLAQTLSFTYCNHTMNRGAFEMEPCALVIMMPNLQYLHISTNVWVPPAPFSPFQLNFPVALPKSMRKLELGCKASPAPFGWDICGNDGAGQGAGFRILRKQNVTSLSFLNASTRNMPVMPLTLGRSVARTRTTVDSLTLFHCDLEFRRPGLHNHMNDLGIVLAFPARLSYLSISYHWDPHLARTVPPPGALPVALLAALTAETRPTYIMLQKIHDSPHVETLVGIRFDLVTTANIITPTPGLHRLRRCRYLETSASHLQYYDSTANGTAASFKQFQNNFSAGDYTTLFPPNLEVLKVTLSMTDFPVLFQLRHSGTQGTHHLWVLHAILIQRLGNPRFLPRLRRIIISDRYTEPIGQARMAYTPGTWGMLYETSFPTVYPFVFATALLQQECAAQNIDFVFLDNEWKHHDSLRVNEGRKPVWEIPAQIAP